MVKAKNETGNIYGKLSVVSKSGRDKFGKALFECLCECSNTVVVRGSDLRKGKYISCGCSKHLPSKLFADEVGNKYSRLTVIERSSNNGNGRATFKCLYSCGNITTVLGVYLRNGSVKSCGCLQTDLARENIKKVRVHYSGEKHPNWQGGITSEYVKARSSKELQEWRVEIFKRDRFTCQKCGNSRGGNLNAHHILNFASHKKLRFKSDNGITMCKSCHNVFHKKYGFVNNTKEQIIEFLVD